MDFTILFIHVTQNTVLCIYCSCSVLLVTMMGRGEITNAPTDPSHILRIQLTDTPAVLLSVFVEDIDACNCLFLKV